MKFLQSKWLLIIAAGAISYIATTLILLNKIHFGQNQNSDETHIVGSYENAKASWNFFNPELEQLVGELKREKEALSNRQNELNEMEIRIKTEYAELLQLTQTVYQLQRDFEQDVIKINEEESENLKKLSKIYSTMTPDSAAKILAQLTDEVIVKILVFMKESESAPIIEALGKIDPNNSKRAAIITEKLRMASKNNTLSKSP
ncbi:MAG: MotE family protein [Verrucomicrobiia bacterium]